MKITFLILITALIAKDTSQLSDPYFMRGMAETLCMAVGGVWILTHFSFSWIKRYWPMIGYVTALLFSAAGSMTPQYVLLQVLSLIAILLFFAAYFESRYLDQKSAVQTIVHATVVIYFITAILGLVMLLVYPEITYDTFKAGDAVVESRYRGLFPKAGMLGSAMGLTIGLVWFSKYWNTVKFFISGICVVSLAMTLSRTYWLALIMAALMTCWIFEKRFRKWLVWLIVIGTPMGFAMSLLSVQVDFKQMKFLRTGTISNLSGRVSLWQDGLQAFYRRPLLGYGYTVGSTGLKQVLGKSGTSEVSIDASRNLGKATLHNGYLQSLLDSGIIGTAFYLSMIVVAIRRVSRQSRSDLEPCRAPFFVLSFMALSNFSENTIYSASVFNSVLFFAFAVFALGVAGRVSPVVENDISEEIAPSGFESRHFKIQAAKGFPSQ